MDRGPIHSGGAEISHVHIMEGAYDAAFDIIIKTGMTAERRRHGVQNVYFISRHNLIL